MRLTHVESTLPPITLELSESKRQEGAAAMKNQASAWSNRKSNDESRGGIPGMLRTSSSIGLSG